MKGWFKLLEDAGVGSLQSSYLIPTLLPSSDTSLGLLKEEEKCSLSLNTGAKATPKAGLLSDLSEGYSIG